MQGSRPLWAPAQHLLQELDHQLPPLPELGGQPSTRRDLDAGSRGGKRDEVGDTQRWYTSTGTMDSGNREIEVPGDIWRREESGHVRP